MTFEQAAFSFGWGELINFARHLPQNSAIKRESNAELIRFSSALQQSSMIADIYDSLQFLTYTLLKVTGNKAEKPKLFPRPWDQKDAQKIGSSPIPISEFNKWYYGGD